MLVAVDTNVLLDQANEEGDVIEAISIIRRRLDVKLIVTPTVLHELAWAVEHADDVKTRNAALHALSNLLSWGYEPLNVVPVGNGIVEQISLKLRSSGALPEKEVNDSFVISEAALIGCGMLLSADIHLIEAQDHPDFRQILKDFDVEGKIIIARPRILVQKFFGH